MTDKLDALKRKIEKLEREIAVQKAGAESDPRRRALYDAGITDPAQLDDAARIFRPSGNASTDVWKLGELSGPIDSLAREFLSTRPWFGSGEPEAKPEPNTRARIENGKAIFADGRSIDAELLTASQLLEMAGPAPKPVEVKPDEAYVNEGEADVDRDWRLAGAAPKAAS